MPPSLQYPQLFVDVQLARVFADSKTFADAIPKHCPATIEDDYLRQRGIEGFSLNRFVMSRFEIPEAQQAEPPGQTVQGGRYPALNAHIDRLWSTLARPPLLPSEARGSALPLPSRYVVPGGRFREVYYWDSYFTMLGLIQHGRRALAQGLVDNAAWQIDHYGHVPNGSRSYYLSRSQPPFFYKMVGLLAVRDGSVQAPDVERLAQSYARYLRQLKQEYAFWMDGDTRVAAGQADRRVVAMPDGAILNRYWDDRAGPRDESYREDIETAASANRAARRPQEQVWRDLRAGAESGWDYSSRWLADGHSLTTIQTTAIVPVDLNGLLYGLEQAISAACRWQGDLPCARRYQILALRRHAAIDRYLWDAQRGYYVDYHWQQGRARTQLTAATVVPLFVDLANARQVKGVAQAVRTRLLYPYGLATTTEYSGQQWDAPNG